MIYPRHTVQVRSQARHHAFRRLHPPSLRHSHILYHVSPPQLVLHGACNLAWSVSEGLKAHHSAAIVIFTSQENQPAFVEAMGDWLTESGRRMRRPRVVQALMRESNNKYSADMDVMRELAREIVAERKNRPNDRKDLLNAMLNGRDPQTGNGLTDESIEDQVRFLWTVNAI